MAKNDGLLRSERESVEWTDTTILHFMDDLILLYVIICWNCLEWDEGN